MHSYTLNWALREIEREKTRTFIWAECSYKFPLSIVANMETAVGEGSLCSSVC
jgi:hypothetical protein